MRRALIGAAALVVSMAIPAGALAGEATDAKAKDKAQASKECKAERGTDAAAREAFVAKYGTGKNGKNAFGKCVSQRTREEAEERKAARASASKACRAERAELGEEAFAEKYGTNRNGKNAFGKCVSAKAKKIAKKQDREDTEEIAEAKNAGKECAAERDELGEEAFAEKYGTNENDKNAFGKCVSGKSDDA